MKPEDKIDIKNRIDRFLKILFTEPTGAEYLVFIHDYSVIMRVDYSFAMKRARNQNVMLSVEIGNGIRSAISVTTAMNWLVTDDPSFLAQLATIAIGSSIKLSAFKATLDEEETVSRSQYEAEIKILKDKSLTDSSHKEFWKLKAQKQLETIDDLEKRLQAVLSERNDVTTQLNITKGLAMMYSEEESKTENEKTTGQIKLT